MRGTTAPIVELRGQWVLLSRGTIVLVRWWVPLMRASIGVLGRRRRMPLLRGTVVVLGTQGVPLMRGAIATIVRGQRVQLIP